MIPHLLRFVANLIFATQERKRLKFQCNTLEFMIKSDDELLITRESEVLLIGSSVTFDVFICLFAATWVTSKQRATPLTTCYVGTETLKLFELLTLLMIT